MRTPETGDWQRTSPFAILFFLGRTLRLIGQNAWQALAPLAALAFAHEGDLLSKAALAGTAFALFVIAAALLSYWFFRFRIDIDSILIRRGVIKKKQLDIKFSRIQGINTEQNPVYRLLGLVTVSFDTAGSSGSEGNLPAVTRAFADSLRARIAGRDRIDTAEPAIEQPAPTPLLRLDWRDMIRIGVADRRALVLLALLGPLYERLGDEIERAIANAIEDAAGGVLELGLATGLTILLAVIAGIMLLLMLFSIVAAFLRYHSFEVLLEGRTLRSTGGLITRHEHSMDLGKIQTLRLQQGIVERWQQRFRLSARQAMAGGRQRQSKLFTIPTVTAVEADTLRRKFLEPEAGILSQNPVNDAFLPVSAHYMRGRILFVGLLPAIVAATGLWVPLGPISLTAIAWPPVVALAAYRSWQRAGFIADQNEIVRRSGLLGYQTVSLLFRKVQRVTVSQSRYQRRKGLASLRFYMASGSVTIPYIDHELARKLRDYVLYRVESSKLAWY